MNKGEGADWNNEEARALRGLAEENASPGAELKPRVIGHLNNLGLLSSRPRGTATWTLWATAAAFAMLGLLVGRGMPSRPTAEGRSPTKYVLLLTGGASATPEENAARRHEYGAWLGELQQRGLTAEGAELVGTRHEFPTGRPNEPVVGYFVVAAGDESEAVAIARANPHLRHGGGVVLAAIR